MRLTYQTLLVFIIASALRFNHIYADFSPSTVTTTSMAKEVLDEIAKDVLVTFNVPGVAIGLVIEDQVVLTCGYGFRNLKDQLEVSENTLFPIASCTKAFTALLLAQLVEEGLISWDDPVHQYIPEFLLFDEHATFQVTIRDLVAHRTGLAPHDAIWLCHPLSKKDVLKIIPFLEPTCGVNEKYIYNNFMYAVAGIIIERVTSQPWEEILTSRILIPLGMQNSHANLDRLQMNSDYSLPYAEIEGYLQRLPFLNTEPVKPGGGIYSNITGMVKWVQLQFANADLLKKTCIQKTTLKEMQSIQIPIYSTSNASISPLGYGLGWIIGNYRGERLVSHGGNVDGFISDVSLLPDHKIGLVILTNSSTGGLYAINTIRNSIFDKLLDLDRLNWKNIEQEKQMKQKQFLYQHKENQEAGVPHSLLAYVGIYEHPAYGTLELAIHNNSLKAIYGDLVISLSYKHPDIFSGQILPFLKYNIKRVVDFTFSNLSALGYQELFVPFEPMAPPIQFRRKNPQT